jgi:hypothetical protein
LKEERKHFVFFLIYYNTYSKYKIYAIKKVFLNDIVLFVFSKSKCRYTKI